MWFVSVLNDVFQVLFQRRAHDFQNLTCPFIHRNLSTVAGEKFWSTTNLKTLDLL